MEPDVDELLRAIEALERTERDQAPVRLSAQYLADIEAVMALPQNQDGADKSWIWPAYEFCRRHFASARRQ
jgi:hypothetical protein